MSGRGDNNQHGSAGRGARNQSNQPFVGDDQNQLKSDHDKHAKNVKTFNLSVDDVPYVVETESFQFNDEERFYVRVNGGTEHVFIWDPQVSQFRSIDDDAATLPDNLEESISQRLFTGRA
jgi:hypothetical protein